MKVGAVIRRNTGRIYVALSSASPNQELLRLIGAKITAMESSPGALSPACRSTAGERGGMPDLQNRSLKIVEKQASMPGKAFLAKPGTSCSIQAIFLNQSGRLSLEKSGPYLTGTADTSPVKSEHRGKANTRARLRRRQNGRKCQVIVGRGIGKSDARIAVSEANAPGHTVYLGKGTFRFRFGNLNSDILTESDE